MTATAKEWDDLTVDTMERIYPTPQLILSAMEYSDGHVHLYDSSLDDGISGYGDIAGDYSTEQEALEAMNFYVLSEHQDMARFAWNAWNDAGTRFGKAYVY